MMLMMEDQSSCILRRTTTTCKQPPSPQGEMASARDGEKKKAEEGTLDTAPSIVEGTESSVKRKDEVVAEKAAKEVMSDPANKDKVRILREGFVRVRGARGEVLLDVKPTGKSRKPRTTRLPRRTFRTI